MIRQYFNEHRLPIAATLVGVFILGIATLLWVVFKPNADSAEAVPEPLRLEYCGAELEQPCVLSFGRDGDGNTIINLFVPKKKFPAFYLKVSRVTGESIAECDRYEEIPTTAYCISAPINLDERIEISILSKADDILLAKGRFTMTAVLIAAGGGEAVTSQPQATETQPAFAVKTRTPSPTPRFSGTAGSSTPSPRVTGTVESSTPSPTVSYPNSPSYP